MKRKIVTITALFVAAIALNGCSTYKTAKILDKEEAKIAFTINKDLSTSMINANTGERILPCKRDLPDNTALKDVKKLIRECLPKEHNDLEEVLVHGEYMLLKGSYCYTGIQDNSLYVYCQPPLNLGFPQ